MKKLLSYCLLLLGTCILLWPLLSFADTYEPEFSLGPGAKGLQVTSTMQATGHMLRHSWFVAVNLSHANFDGCDLSDVTFKECDLSHASFRNATLKGAFIEGGNISGADVTDATINAIEGSGGHFTPHQLKSTRSYKQKDLSECNIDVTTNGISEVVAFDFSGCNLREAFFGPGDYRQSDFTGADITQAHFSGCQLTSEQIKSTESYLRKRLYKVGIGGTVSGQLELRGFDLSGSGLLFNLTNVDFQDAEIRGCALDRSFSAKQLIETRSYRQGDLSGVSFRGVDLSHCDLSAQNLTGCLFVGPVLRGAKFDDAIISAADFGNGINFNQETARGLTVEQLQSTWNFRHQRTSSIKLPPGLHP